MINLIHRGTSPIVQEQNGLSPVAGEVGISEESQDFHTHLIAKGTTEKHARTYRNRIRVLVDAAGSRRLSDLSSSGIQAALKGLGTAGHSLRTLNHYLRAIKAFSRWLQGDQRVANDPLIGMRGYNADTDVRHRRRALTTGECSRLIEAADRGPIVMRISGRDRAMIYRLALATGLRANELGA